MSSRARQGPRRRISSVLNSPMVDSASALDYRADGREPRVAYVDQDREPRVIARIFAEIVDRFEDSAAGRGSARCGRLGAATPSR